MKTGVTCQKFVSLNKNNPVSEKTLWFIIIYALCKHNKLRTLVVSLTLQQVKEVSMVETKEAWWKQRKNIGANADLSFM